MRSPLIALAAVVGLVLAGTAAFFVFRPSPAEPLGRQESTAPPPAADLSPNDPFQAYVTTSSNTLIAAKMPDELGPIPEKLNPDDKSISGSTSCDAPFHTLRQASAREANTRVNVMLVPRAFEEFTVTDFRIPLPDAEATNDLTDVPVRLLEPELDQLSASGRGPRGRDSRRGVQLQGAGPAQAGYTPRRIHRVYSCAMKGAFINGS